MWSDRFVIQAVHERGVGAKRSRSIAKASCESSAIIDSKVLTLWSLVIVDVRTARWQGAKTINIYLDVDGVLITYEGTLAHHADRFLTMIMNSGHPVHWLTTRCREGNAAHVVRALSRLVQPSTAELLSAIKPTSWTTSKLEAIDLHSPFVWFDDRLMQFEINELEDYGLRDCWVRIDLIAEPEQLGTIRLFENS